MNQNVKQMGYKIDFANQKFIMTKAFADKANTPTSEEFKLLAEVMKQFPQFTIVGRTHKSPKKTNANKGLTYKKMVRYISTYDNADKLLQIFDLVKIASKPQKNPYKYVKDWFVENFPDYNKIPQFTNGKRYAVVKCAEEEKAA